MAKRQLTMRVLQRAHVPLIVFALSACGGSGLREGSPPTDPVADVSKEQLFDTGMSFASQGDFVRAEQYLAAAGARGYDETQLIGPLVRVCVAASRLRQALLYAEPYLRRHPDDWRLRFVVAAIQLGLDRVADAKTALERVVTAAPDAPEPHFALATLLRERMRDEPGSKPHFERYLALAPTGPHADEARVALATPLPPAETPPAPESPTGVVAPAVTPTATVSPAAVPPAAVSPAAVPPAAVPSAAVPPTAVPRATPVRLPRRAETATSTGTGTTQ